jgi:hypothetical protein
MHKNQEINTLMALNDLFKPDQRSKAKGAAWMNFSKRPLTLRTELAIQSRNALKL